jgi:hypothetical protein
VNPIVTVLDVANNDIGDGGAQMLALALRSNRSLTTLNVEQNNIGVRLRGDCAVP